VSEQRIDVAFGAQIGQLLAGLTEVTGAVRGSVEEMKASFEGLSAVAEMAFAPLIAIAAILEGGEIFRAAVEKTAEFGKQLEITSQKTGMTVEALSALQYAADLSDVSTEQLTTGMQRLARAMEGAEKGTGPANDAFNALGIAVLNADNHMRPMHDVLLDLAARFQGMEDGAGKTALAMDLFGRSGATLIPLLNQGAEGITELEAKARSLGVTMGQEGVNTAAAYTDQMKEFHQVINSLERTLALRVMPVLTLFAGWAETVALHIDDIKTAVELALPPLLLLDKILGHFIDQKQLADMLAAARLPTAPAKTTAPSFDKPVKDLSQLEEWIEELNKRKQLALDNNEDLKQVELDFWKSKLAIAQEGSKEYIEIHSKILTIEEELARQAKAAQATLAKETTKEWVSVFNAIPSAFDQALKGVGKSVFTMRDLFRTMFTDITKMSAEAGLRMLRDHVAAELAKHHATVASVTAQVAIRTWGALESVAQTEWAAVKGLAIELAHAIKSMAIYSGKMFMGMASWLSDKLGPFAIPVALGVTAAAVGVGASMMSAAGGYDIPAGLNPMTQLHAQEMVLPAELANRVRGMAGGPGGSGSVVHNHYIYAMDSQSFNEFAKRNPEAFGNGMAGAIAINHSALANALRKRG
jgi:hypothetical protein